MTLGTSESILVIILSVLLAIFLVLSIAIAILVLKVINQVKSVIEKAHTIADQAEHVTTFFKDTSAPVAIGKMIANIFNANRERRERNK